MESTHRPLLGQPEARQLRAWLARLITRLHAALAIRRGLAELRAMDNRELQDLGLDRGGIGYTATRGRDGR
ncbi:MAG: DUF1127 domain-containing protein [Pseudomonadota bacterium]